MAAPADAGPRVDVRLLVVDQQRLAGREVARNPVDGDLTQNRLVDRRLLPRGDDGVAVAVEPVCWNDHRGEHVGIDGHDGLRQVTSLETWLQGLSQQFASRILPITFDVAEEWGRLSAKRPLPAADSLIAATANVHGLILATRNVNDIRDVAVHVINPFEFGET